MPRKKTKAKKSEQGKETVPNANYLWINLFATSLKEPDEDDPKGSPGGRAALVIANSASDARHSEADIRRTLIEHNLNLCDGQLAVEYVLHGDIAGDPVILRQIARDWVTGE
ncbi:MAG: hypothetical protein WBM40_03000, partial [Thiohalocapsa sp.]